MSRNRATLPALSCAMSWARVQHKPSTELGGRPSSMRPLTIPIKSPPDSTGPITYGYPCLGPRGCGLTAYRSGGDAGTIGVATNGTEPGYSEMISALEAQKEAIVAELPEGTTFRPSHSGKSVTISTQRRASEFTTDDEMRRWLASTLNSYVNALRPRLKALMQEQRLEQL